MGNKFDISIKIDWDFCQNNSDQLLAEGLYYLSSQSIMNHREIVSTHRGNYLILMNKEPYYIGEAKNLIIRLKQQFRTNTTNFYKTYINSNGKDTLKSIEAFKVQYMETNIGRKEIEEFAIVNIPTKLNKFQRYKRDKVVLSNTYGLWLEVQRLSFEILTEGERNLFLQNRVPWFSASIPHKAGVYIVWNTVNDKIVYIGESSDIGERYKTHSGRTYFSALRRHIGTEILNFTLKKKNGKARYFSEDEDVRVTNILRACKIAFLSIDFGRFELEELLIRKFHPLLNRKDNEVL